MTIHMQSEAIGFGAIRTAARAIGRILGKYANRTIYARLQDLDERILKDVGLTREDIERMRRMW